MAKAFRVELPNHREQGAVTQAREVGMDAPEAKKALEALGAKLGKIGRMP